jgi:hypothetical protein
MFPTRTLPVTVIEAPAAARAQAVDAAPLVTAEGRWAATWAGNLDAARAAGASDPVINAMPLALVRGIKEAESQLVKQLLYSGIVKVLGFT